MEVSVVYTNGVVQLKALRVGGGGGGGGGGNASPLLSSGVKTRAGPALERYNAAPDIRAGGSLLMGGNADTGTSDSGAPAANRFGLV